MDVFIRYLLVFLCGGLLCVPAQILICKTKLTPARILTGYVVAGVLFGASGLYAPLIKIFRSGAKVPLTGFGALLAEGTAKAVSEKGLIGALSGPLSAMSAGVAAAIVMSLICALIFRSKRI
jgi:stage V sporulation protein AE